MARPKAKSLTQRELEVMHVFWRKADGGEDSTAAQVRDELAASGRELAYTTVATLVRILCDKGFLAQTNLERFYDMNSIGWGGIGKWTGSGWKKAEAAFQLSATAVAACVMKSPKSDDW